ncbi:DUF4238 domain-containing protein [Gilvimarinus sp. DA14]|uniref:DUF4238 domain-containing protein n=1 Tax=Gilvimarinus sp. DA14 TaxID=2956798 RepID=UPI0020B795CD|nr:DUF4238 domain-containing protein [Gilvimarinus sp. DA14]UTF59136.1 DUF4238 domain-containing protein [Gilvimarinus sp. DA14]
MNGRPTIQHWVPRFYLKQFATEETRGTSNPKVWVINKDDSPSEPELVTTRRICGQRFLYTPEGSDGRRDWSLEEYFSGLESGAAEYWEALSSLQLDLSEPEVRSRVAEFLAALHLRNKFVFDLCKGIMEKRDALFGRPRPIQKIAGEEVNDDRPDLTNPGKIFAQSTRDGIPRIKKLFESYRWMILKCEKNVLTTSDVPVTFIDSIPRRSGPGSKDAKAVFPVSPSTLLCMVPREGQPETLCGEVDCAFFQDVNQAIENYAERFVVLGTKDAANQWFQDKLNRTPKA